MTILDKHSQYNDKHTTAKNITNHNRVYKTKRKTLGPTITSFRIKKKNKRFIISKRELSWKKRNRKYNNISMWFPLNTNYEILVATIDLGKYRSTKV